MSETDYAADVEVVADTCDPTGVSSLSFGRGRIVQRRLALTKPAAATGFSWTVGDANNERLLSLCFTVAADAGAGSRNLRLALEDADSNVVFAATSSLSQQASQTWVYTFAVGISTVGFVSNAAAAFASVGVPPIIVRPGWTWAVSFIGVNAGDQISAIFGVVEQWPTSPGGVEQRGGGDGRDGYRV